MHSFTHVCLGDGHDLAFGLIKQLAPQALSWVWQGKCICQIQEFLVAKRKLLVLLDYYVYSYTNTGSRTSRPTTGCLIGIISLKTCIKLVGHWNGCGRLSFFCGRLMRHWAVPNFSLKQAQNFWQNTSFKHHAIGPISMSISRPGRFRVKPGAVKSAVKQIDRRLKFQAHSGVRKMFRRYWLIIVLISMAYSPSKTLHLVTCSRFFSNP